MTGSSVDSGFAAAFSHRPARLRMLWITASLGACFLGVRWGLRDAPLLWFAALRALLGGAALAAVAIAQRRPLPRSAATWGGIGVLGLINVSLAFWAMFAGIAGLATGTAAVLANAQPLLILLPAWWLFGERVTARTGLALVVGFGGLLVVAVPGGGGQGALLSLLSAAAVTTGTLMVRRLDGVDVVVASAAHLLLGGTVLASVAFAMEGVPHIDWTPRFVAVLIFLGLIATAATTLAWFVETRRCPLSTLTPWMFLVPIFGLLIGIAALHERPDAWMVTGIVLVLISMRVALTKHPTTGAGPPGHLYVADSAVDKLEVHHKPPNPQPPHDDP
ncbi:DMT family transporter [Rhodococcus sp. ARC_M6]|uniref:DMT family transporter n=1 Tax=Rhodococcus sp. ARC_M6 TaxID=2928852 RepID=UPI001FB1A4DD|nr:DMT family transporter [Rhodococcus sp. ARC_M6]MCJ0905208.1 DMT family transporter [Rhodococcus sp. ARC_M6]